MGFVVSRCRRHWDHVTFSGSERALSGTRMGSCPAPTIDATITPWCNRRNLDPRRVDQRRVDQRKSITQSRSTTSQNTAFADLPLLRQAMSDSWSLPQVDLAPGNVDDELVRRYSGQRLMAENWIPVRALQDGSILVATARVPDAGRAAYIAAVVHAPVTFGVATSWDIRHAVLRIYNLAIAEQAANELWDHNPQLSAKMVLSHGQKAELLALFVVAGLAVMWPLLVVLSLVALLSFGFLAGIAFRFIVALRGAKVDIVERVSDREVADLRDGDLPMYTVLVPVFREANIVGGSWTTSRELDYPQDKLEILLLIEEEDHRDAGGARAAHPPDMVIRGRPAGPPADEAARL